MDFCWVFQKESLTGDYFGGRNVALELRWSLKIFELSTVYTNSISFFCICWPKKASEHCPCCPSSYLTGNFVSFIHLFVLIIKLLLNSAGTLCCCGTCAAQQLCSLELLTWCTAHPASFSVENLCHLLVGCLFLPLLTSCTFLLQLPWMLNVRKRTFCSSCQMVMEVLGTSEQIRVKGRRRIHNIPLGSVGEKNVFYAMKETKLGEHEVKSFGL